MHDLVIPFNEITGLEKKNVVGFIPNAIEIACASGQKVIVRRFSTVQIHLLASTFSHLFFKEILPLI